MAKKDTGQCLLVLLCSYYGDKVTGSANANTTIPGGLNIRILKWLMASCDIEIKEQSSLLFV